MAKTTEEIFLLVLLMAGGIALADSWVLLGRRTVTDRLDHDTITVSSIRGNFHRIKVTVREAPVQFHRLVVHYGTGGDNTIPVADHLPPAARLEPSICAAGTG